MKRQKHNRRSIRLKGYDYSQPGLYFLTLLCHKRKHLFGRVIRGEMQLNPAGQEAERCWLAIPDYFPQVVLHAFIIMPNHIHGIIELLPLPPEKKPEFSPSTNSFQSPSQTVGSIVRGFKSGLTKWMRSNTQHHITWHRNYYEHIIRTQKAYNNITQYIQTNPQRWQSDRFHPANATPT